MSGGDTYKCPHCGHERKVDDEFCDSGLEFDQEPVICGSCERGFYVHRSVTFYYSTQKKDVCENCRAWKEGGCVLGYETEEAGEHHEAKKSCIAPWDAYSLERMIKEKDPKYWTELLKEIKHG